MSPAPHRRFLSRLAAAFLIALLAIAPAAAQEIGGKYALAGETSAGDSSTDRGERAGSAVAVLIASSLM